jgi:hypothetical protein
MCGVIKIATWPARIALDIAADILFGKADPTEYVSVTVRRD